MAGTTVDYIIKLLADDSQLKKQLKSTSGEISKLTAREKKEIKEVVQARMDGLNAQAKAAKKNPGNSAIVSGLEEELKFMREVFSEMKALNPAEDWAKSGKVFAQTFSNMNKQLSDLAKIIEPLKGSIAELGASFGNLGFDIAPQIDVSAATKQATKAIDGIGDVVITRVHNVSKDIKRAYNTANKFLADMNKNMASAKQFKSVDDVRAKLTSLYRAYEINYSQASETGDREAARYAKEIFDSIQKAEKQFSTFSGKSIFNESQFEQMQNMIDDQIAYAQKKIEKYNDEVQKAFELDLADKLTKNLKGLNLSIDLPKQADFVKKINKFVDQINEKKLHTIKVNIDDSFNLNKKKKKKNADPEQETEEGISQSGLAKFENAIDKMQTRTKDKTKTWREEMLKMLKFKSGDFEFNFGNSLMDNLQQYFYEPGHELDILINEDELKRRIENVIKDSGGVIGSSSGTATFDPKMMASAVYSAIQAALTGKEMPTFDFGDTSTTQEKVGEATDEANESSIKYVKTLDETTIHIDKVIESLKQFAKISQNSKAGKAVDKWLLDNGIDTSLIRAGAVNDAEIRAMLQEVWMREDNMGHAAGSTVVAQIADFFSKYKSLKPDTGAGKALATLKSDIVELFKMLEVPMETLEEWEKRTGNLQIYEDAAKHGRGLALLNKFRPKLKTSAKAMKEGATADDLSRIKLTDIEEAISYFASNGWDTKHLEGLRDARKTLGDGTNSEQIKAFQTAATTFYEKSRDAFDFLNKKYGNFAGDIYIEGRKNPIPVNSPKDFLKIPEDAVIVDPRIYEDIGSSRVGNWDERKEEYRALREQGRQSHQERKEYEQDILNKVIKVEDFKPLEAPPEQPLKIEERVQTLRDNIVALEQEYVNTDKAIKQLDTQIEKSAKAVEKQRKSTSDAVGSSRIKVYTQEYDDKYWSILEKNKAAHVIQDTLKANKGFGDVPLAYGDVIPKNITANLTKLDAVVKKAGSLQKHLDYITKHSSKEDIDKEFQTLGKDGQYQYDTKYDERVNSLLKERFELYKKIKENNYDASGVIGGIGSELGLLRTREASLKDKVSAWSKSEVDKSEKSARAAQNALKPLIQTFRTEVNGLVDEIVEIASKLDNPNLKGKSREDLVAKLQNKLQILHEAEGEYSEFRKKVDSAPESLLNVAKRKSADDLYDRYVVKTQSVYGSRKDKLSELQESDIRLRSRRSALESQKKENELKRESAQHNIVRLEKQIEYNALKEQELKLQEQIEALEDGQEKDVKANDLGNVQIRIASLEKEIDALGGFVGRGESKVYTQEEQKSHALESAKKYQLQLIEAYAQRNAITDRVADIDKLEKQVDKYGLKVGYGDRAYNQYKMNMVDEFRAKARAQLKEQLGLNDAKFQVEPTLMSEEVYSLKQQLYETLEEQTKAIVDKFRESIHINDKGMLEATEFKWDDDSDGAVESAQVVRDVRKHILDELKARKEILIGEDGARIKEIEALIQTIKTERDKALTYGGLDYDEIKNDDIIQEQVRYQQEINKLIQQKSDIEANDALDAKEKEKELARLNQEIQGYQTLILNREKLVELRAKEKEESKWSAEERQVYYTDKLIKSKESLKKINGEIATLERTMNEAVVQHGKNSKEAAEAQYAYDKKLEARQRILDTMANANKKLGYANQELERGGVTVSDTTKQGGLFGQLASAIKEGLAGVSGGTIDIDNSDIATETTLRAIFEMLSGGGQASAALDDEKARGREEREARRREEQARVIAEEKQRKAEQDAERSSGGQSKTAKQKDRLNAEGQAQFNAIKNAASDLQKELKELDKQSVLGKMADQVTKLHGMNKGTVEYLQEQYKLANMVFAYTGKLKDEGVTSDTRKDGTKYLKYNAVLERSEVKKLGDVKSLMVASVKDLADNLIKLGFGAKLGRNTPKDSTDLDIHPSIDMSQKIEKMMLEVVGNALPLNDIRDIVGKAASNIMLEQGDNGKSIDKHEFYEKNADAIVNKAFDDVLVKRFRYLHQALSDDKITPDESVELDKVLKLLTDRGVYKGSKQETVEGEQPLENEKQVSIEPKIAPGAVAEEVKENVAEAPAKANITPNIEDLSSLDDDTLTNRFLELQYLTDTDQITASQLAEFQKVIELIMERGLNSEDDDEDLDEEGTDEERQAILDAINNVGEKVVADKTEDIAPAINDSKSTEKSTASGGIIGIMRSELAQESTLKQVLTALGEIAKKNAMAGAGKANSAQDLLEQFRRMLESDAWEGRERVAYVDLATGTMSNSITGDDKQISAERLNILRSAYKDVMDLNAQVHTHANEDDPYFSKDDLSLFASDFADGITKQILLSKNNMTVLDMDGVQDVNGLLDALAKTEQNFEALATTADKFGAKYVSRAFNEITPQGLVKMLGIKGIESKYTETETRDSAVQGILKEDAKVAADMLQESTGRAIKKTVERVGAELMTTTEKTDAKGNKTWSNQISDKYTKAAIATNRAFKNLGLENEFGVGTDAQLALVDYTNKYEEFLRLIEEFKKNPKQEGLQEQFDKLLPELDAAEEKLNKLIISKDKFLNGKEAIKIFEGADLANAGDSLKSLATARYTKNGLNPGDNIAFNGISETPNGTRLLVDILKDGTIQQFALEVDRATGQVKEFMTAETALANAFQNVNKAMRYNETVMANVAVGDNPAEQAEFMINAHSAGLDAYREAMSSMEKYVADIWNRMAQGGASASKEELDYIMALSERVIALGKNVQKTSLDFKNFRAQNPDDVFGYTINHQGYNRDDRVREELENQARRYASANNSAYNFSSFDNDTLQFTLTDVEGHISKVAYVWNELYQQIAMVSDKSTSALDPMIAQINRYDEALQQAVQDGYLMDNDANFDAFYQAQGGIQFLIDGIKNGYETFDTSKDKLEELRREALKYGEAAIKVAKQNKKLYTGTNEINSVNRQKDRIIGAFGVENFDNSNVKVLASYKKTYGDLMAMYNGFKTQGTLYDPSNQEQLRQQAIQVQILGKKLMSTVTQASKLQELVDQSGYYTDSKGIDHMLGGKSEPLSEQAASVNNLKSTMLDYVQNTLKHADVENVRFNKTTQQLTYTQRINKDTVADMVVQYNAAENALFAYNKQERESLTGFPAFMKGMKAKIASIMQYIGSITSIYRVWGEIRRGIQYIREIDSALTELRKVTDETEKTYDRFLDTAAKTADKVGSTIKEIVSSTADWARIGYSLKDATTLAESTAVLLNVSEFKSIEDATSALTSTLQAFGYTASQSMNVVDVMNEVGNSFAVSSDGIATALQDSASSLMAANNSYEEAVALIAAANRVVQDPNSVGAALRTISLRLRGTSAKELEEAGEDATGAIESKSKLRSKIKGYTGIDILTDSGAYKSTYEILLEISKVWDDLTDMNRAGLLELIAGKTRSNTAAAILSNTKDLEEAYKSAMEAEGSAYEENEKYLDSIQGRIDLFNNSVQTMWNNTLDSDVVKWIVDIGTELIKFIDKIGLVQSALLALGTGLGLKHLFKDIKISSIDIQSLLSYINSLTVGFQKNAVAQTAVNAATLKQDLANKLLKNSIIQRLAAENLDGQIKDANLAREVRLVAAKQALELAEEQYAEGLIDDIALQAAKNAVDSASVPINLSQFSATTLLGAAFKGLALSIWEAVKAIGAFLFTNPIGWMILLVGAVASGIAIFNHFHKTTEELTEELDALKSELRDIQSEFDSLNAELETTQSRMAELLSMDSLSFTEKEELDNLKKQNDELQRKLDLLELEKKHKQEESAKKFVEVMNSDVNDYGEYYSDGSKATWLSEAGFILNGQSVDHYSEKQILDKKLKNYQYYKDKLAEVEQQIIDAGGEDTKQGKKLVAEKKHWQTMIEDAETFIRDKQSQFLKNSEGIEYFTGDNLEDWQIASNEWLDYVNNVQDEWAIVSGGANAKTNAINRIFNKEEFSKASDTIDTLVEKLKKNPGDTTIINQIRQQCKLAEEDLNAVGLSVEDAVDSFTMLSSDSSFDTVEKKIKELGDASKKFSDLLNGGTFKVDGVDTGLVDLFNEEGKIIQTKLSQIFTDTDEQTRKEITNVLEGAYDTIKDGINDGEIAQLTTKLGFKFARQIMEAQKKELAGNTIELFPGLEDEISGIIDTFDELVKSVGSVVDALDTLDKARAEEVYSGSVSLETLSKLMTSTENYADLIEVDETGAIKLATNAQEILVQQKIDAIKKNAELALADAELALQEAIHAEQTYTQTGPAQEFLRGMTMEVGGAVAFVSSLWNDLISGNFDGAWDRAVASRNNTIAQNKSQYAAEAAEASAAVEDARQRVENAEKMNKIAQGLTPDNVKTRYYSDEASGGTDNASDAAEKKANDALESLQEKYERQIKNLDNQQTYIENEIEKLEAKDEAVSKSYYEKQIELEEKKLDLYKQERDALKQLEMTDDVADALWEVEHAIQESTLRMIEFRQSIIDLYTTAFDKAIEAYDNKDDFLSDQQNYIDKYRQLMEMNDSPLKASGYQEQLDAEWAKKNANIAELALLEQIYADAMANGLKEGSEEWVDLQDKIRATEEAILDNNIAIEEYAEAMRQIPVEAFNSVREMFGYQTDFLTKQQDYVEGYADYLEAIGVDVPREVYDKLIEIEQEKRNNTLADLVDARQGLVDIEAQGFTAADEEWQDAYNKITDLEKAIQDSDIAMAQWEKTIRDMDFEKFERFTNRIDDLSSEIDHVRNLLDDEDVAFTDGTWTEEGITSLGLLYQQMQIAEQKSKEYADKIEELNETYQSGSISEQEYYERLQELKEGQWEAIESYQDAKDAIVDMEEARIDMIEEGINEEIEAYQELIDLKKEELDAEKDLYDFKKNIQKQTKDIASLQRRIASMSGSTDASTIAERTKLQAQLREAQEGLDDTYYSHSMDAQSKALDDENEAYAKSKEDYLEMLRDTLDDTAAIINTKISEFLLNADVGLGELNGISQEHGITLSDSLMQPWINASMVSETFKQNADLNLFSLINEDGIVTIFNTTATEAFDSAFGAGGSAASLFKATVNEQVGIVKSTVEQSTSPLTTNLKYPWEATSSEDGPINTFSETAKDAISGAVTKAQNNAEAMKNSLSSPWTSAGQAVNTFSTTVSTALDAAMRKIDEYVKKLNEAKGIETPNYTGTSNNGSDNGNDNGNFVVRELGPKNNNSNAYNSAVRDLQTILNTTFKAGINADGYWGPITEAALQNAQTMLKRSFPNIGVSVNGKYDEKTKAAMDAYINHQITNGRGLDTTVMYANLKKLPNVSAVGHYAKGTISTKRDEFAITDESWIGEEITLAAGKNGQLQYLKKGSAVLPSDIASNLVEWGKINPDMSAFSNGLQGMNVMTSVLNKPELNLEFGSLLHIDNCSNEVIPEVKKMVTEALDKFSRQLNYSLRRVGAK